VESLDDLFDDVQEDKLKEEKKIKVPDVEYTGRGNNKIENFEEDNKEDFAPILPQDEKDTYDLQKELEAKFDELFGPIDEE